MTEIRVVSASASGPTVLSSYDAALAAANLENYNLVPLSSVIPAGARVSQVDRAPDLGAVGDRLHVVQARTTVALGARSDPSSSHAGTTASAGLGWQIAESGRGIFYEANAESPRAVREELEAGLAAGRDLREWDFGEDPEVCIESVPDTETTGQRVANDDGATSGEMRPDGSGYATAVVIAAYGTGDPIV